MNDRSQSEGAAYPESVQRLLNEFARLPGIGRRSAERLAFHVLKAEREDAMGLARAIHDVKTNVRHCPVCFNFAEGEQCAICADPRRERATVLIVEQPKDLISIEQTGMYRGVYHVLLGRLAPLEGVGPEALTIARLIERVEDPASNSGGEPVREVILGLNPTLEGDGTALFLAEEMERRSVRVTRLARGLPSGRELEFASKAVLADAIEGRQPMR
ncbi:MAG: recombination mediator RecR [Planctomycetota bacterium]